MIFSFADIQMFYETSLPIIFVYFFENKKIIFLEKKKSLNKRTEIIQKYRHREDHLLKYFE